MHTTEGGGGGLSLQGPSVCFSLSAYSLRSAQSDMRGVRLLLAYDPIADK